MSMKYARTNKKYEGLRVYKAYMFDEFIGYAYKERAKQLQQKRNRQGKIVQKEINVGWKYTTWTRPYEIINNQRVFWTWEKFSTLFN